MEQPAAEALWGVAPHARFELAPPRRFLFPALLLLLSEEPGYGYHLAKGLQELRFGRVDRPSVYRALAQLEGAGLVESWPGTPRAGKARRLYGLTLGGERALREWMGVIKQERDSLDQVLRRYVATGTTDAIVAGAEGGWAGVTGPAWSTVSPTSRSRRRSAVARPAVRSTRPEATPGGAAPAVAAPPVVVTPPVVPTRFEVIAERSAVLIEARSSVGPITFGAVGVTGTITAEVEGDAIRPGSSPAARLELEVAKLSSGNSIYDAELLRRIDARRYPTVVLDLRRCVGVGSADRYHVDGEITFHGATRPAEGSVGVALTPERRLVVSGEQVFDIRDFDMASPTVLMLRIYPDVVVQLQVEAEAVAWDGPA
jgi:PadR family transcriptional regulator PadR